VAAAYAAWVNARYPETVPTALRPHVGLADASPYAHLRQYVVSGTLGSAPDPAVTVIGGDALARVRALKAQEGRDTRDVSQRRVDDLVRGAAVERARCRAPSRGQKTTSARPPLPAIMLSKAAGMPSSPIRSVTRTLRSRRPARMCPARTGRSTAGSELP
jgi:hypothetical protein